VWWRREKQKLLVKITIYCKVIPKLVPGSKGGYSSATLEGEGALI